MPCTIKQDLNLFKHAMLSLEKNGRIYKDGKESYYIKELAASDTEKQIVGLLEREEFDTIAKLEHILNQHIKSQIKIELDLLLKDYKLFLDKINNANDSKTKENKIDHRLIANLNNEITFLRSELLNINKIIEMLMANSGHNFETEK